jgi:hypothetical protein
MVWTLRRCARGRNIKPVDVAEFAETAKIVEAQKSCGVNLSHPPVWLVGNNNLRKLYKLRKINRLGLLICRSDR